MAEAWERFNEIQQGCPHHNIEKWSLLQIFYEGLTPYDKTMLDANNSLKVLGFVS